jgi:hypothetical protein
MVWLTLRKLKSSSAAKRLEAISEREKLAGDRLPHGRGSVFSR